MGKKLDVLIGKEGEAGFFFGGKMESTSLTN